ncbi:flagellar hook assembly protein FlgD [Marinobacteraceae bacterium S3BR75-40.1]
MSTINTQSASDVLSRYAVEKQQSDAPKKANDLGKNEFMDLMLAQMNNQNPLKPQDNGEFIAQLAQFSSLEEMQKLTQSVDTAMGQFRSSQALQASAMVGQSVVVPSETAQLGADGKVSGMIDLAASTSNLQLSVLNGSGELVRQVNLGPHGGGQVPFEWDGKNESGNLMPPGQYSLKAEASYPDGTEQMNTLISSNVDSVSLGKDGSVTLNLAGMGSVPLSEVRQIN